MRSQRERETRMETRLRFAALVTCRCVARSNTAFSRKKRVVVGDKK